MYATAQPAQAMGPRAILAAGSRRGLSAVPPAPRRGLRGLGSQISLPPAPYASAVITSTGVQLSPEDAAIAHSVVVSVAAKYGLDMGIQPFAPSTETLATMIADNVYDPTLSGFLDSTANCYQPAVIKYLGGAPSSAQLVNQTTGMAAGGASIALSMAGVAGPVGALVSLGAALVGLFTALFQQHVRNMAHEEEAICPAMPSAVQAFQAITGGVQDGTIDAATGSAGLDSLVSEFSQAVQPQLHMGGKNCSAGCIYILQLIACCAKMQYLWSMGQGVAQAGSQVALTDAGGLTPQAIATNPVAGAVQGASNLTGLPQAALWLLGLFVIYQLA